MIPTNPSQRMRLASTRVVLVLTLTGALLAPLLGTHDINLRFSRLLNAPPTMIHVVDVRGDLRAPFVHPWRLVDQLEQRYEPEVNVAVPLAWFTGGHLLASSDDGGAPFLPLGTDSYGRDVFARLLSGAQTSVGLSLVAACGALGLGALIGAWAGYRGRLMDDAMMRVSDVLLVLPGIYVALALRAVLPLVLAPREVFTLLAAIFAILGTPIVTRGVRAIVRVERRQDYIVAAESLGASPFRVIVRHLIPATAGFLQSQLTLLVPAFIVAEATLSYVGLGFPESVASWGTMLQEASSVRALADFPWLLSPAVAMFLLVLGLNVVGDTVNDRTNRHVDPFVTGPRAAAPYN
jgi:peptide/nickel transport system permease protein